MKKLLIPVLGVVLGTFVACDDSPENPGDFNVKCSLEITGLRSAAGHVYPWEVGRTVDSQIVRSYIKYDTIFSETGKPQEITKDTVYYASNTRTTFHFVNEVTLENGADTLYIDLKSNAKWSAPVPELGSVPFRWFVPQNIAGGGDGTITVALTANPSSKKDVDSEQTVFTADSAVMYVFKFIQKHK